MLNNRQLQVRAQIRVQPLLWGEGAVLPQVTMLDRPTDLLAPPKGKTGAGGESIFGAPRSSRRVALLPLRVFHHRFMQTQL